jgi:uncharacterized protein
VSLPLLLLLACATASPPSAEPAASPAASPATSTATRSDPADGATTPQGPTIPLAIGHRVLQVEVADTDAERARGLMFRDGLALDHGMVFVYPNERVRGFWMKNTRIPLAIAFADARGRIVHIAEMLPYDETSTDSVSPAMYAVEMRAGWFAEHGIAVGDRIEGLPLPSRE